MVIAKNAILVVILYSNRHLSGELINYSESIGTQMTQIKLIYTDFIFSISDYLPHQSYQRAILITYCIL